MQFSVLNFTISKAHLRALVKTFALFLLTYAFAILGTIFDLKVFLPWDQVTTLWELGPSLLDLVGHPHLMRYLVALPGLLMEERWPEVGFSVYAGLFVSLNVILLRAISKIVVGKSPSWVVYVVFLLAHFMMNGRGAIAWTGWLVCVWVYTSVSYRGDRSTTQLLCIALSLVLASVTSGVFIVVYVALALLLFRNFLNLRRRELWRWLVFVVAGSFILFGVLEHFIVVINKNIEFYGGGFAGAIAMVEHGIGAVIVQLEVPLIIIFCLLASAIIMFFTFIAIRRARFSALEHLIGMAFVGGVFGYTVLTLVIPPLLIWAQTSRVAKR